MARNSSGPSTAATVEKAREVVDQLDGSITSEITASAITTQAPARVDSIPLSKIKDGGAQMRAEMRDETVDDYASDMLNGAVFPPIVVFYDGND